MDELMMQALDGTIGDTDRAKLNAYLQAHADEREMFERMLQADAAFAQDAQMLVPVPAGLSTNVMANVYRVAAFQPQTYTALNGKQILLIVMLCSVAMATAMALGGGLLAYSASFAPEVTRDLFRSVFTLGQNSVRVLYSVGRAVFSQPAAWVISGMGLLACVMWSRIVATVWLPQRVLA